MRGQTSLHSVAVGKYLILEQNWARWATAAFWLYPHESVFRKKSISAFITLSEITRNGFVTTWLRDTEFCARIN